MTDESTHDADGVTIIVPARDEEAGLLPTLEAIRGALRDETGPVEIIVIDDGSTDATAQLAAGAGVRVLHHPASGGYGKALHTGIHAARTELIAITDADGTYPVERLPVLLRAAREGFDLVIGARTGPRYWGSVLKSPARSLFLLLTSFVVGKWIPDPNSGLRVFRRSQVLPILPHLPRGFSFTTTQTLILTLSHAFVVYIPIPYRARLGRSKVRFVRDALQVGQTTIEVMLRYNPLKLFVLLGTIPVLLAPVVWRLASPGAQPIYLSALGLALVGCACSGMIAVILARRDGR